MAGYLAAVGRARDRAAFAALYVHFAPRVKSYLLRLGMADARAEDVAQETMLMIWRKASLYDPDRAAASTWVFTIARNLRADALRRERPQATNRADAGTGAGAGGEALLPVATEQEANAELPNAAPGAEEVFASTERAGRLKDALRRLPQEQAQILDMSYFAGKTHAEIGCALGVPLGTVKSRIRLALARLRTALEGG
jgi:RNA polymerase sigma-70 factor (ECF subfamily)